MHRDLRVGVAVPALDEESSIGLVVGDLLALRGTDGIPVVDDIVVCDNGCTDNTASAATAAGARVVHEPRRGYGSACQAAVGALKPTDVVLFTDGDHAFDATGAIPLLDGIADGADLVIGSRTLGRRDRGALTRSQEMGNRVATTLIRLLWGRRMTDLGPYRAIRSQALSRLEMADPAFGWTVEMQVKAVQQGLQVAEVPVDTRVRLGESKISGTLRGAIGAGFGILSTIVKLRLQQSRRSHGDPEPSPAKP